MDKRILKNTQVYGKMVDEFVRAEEDGVTKVEIKWCEDTQGYLVYVTKKIDNDEEATYIVGVER